MAIVHKASSELFQPKEQETGQASSLVTKERTGTGNGQNLRGPKAAGASKRRGFYLQNKTKNRIDHLLYAGMLYVLYMC